jgi:hypothetical protein
MKELKIINVEIIVNKLDNDFTVKIPCLYLIG